MLNECGSRRISNISFRRSEHYVEKSEHIGKNRQVTGFLAKVLALCHLVQVQGK